MGLPIAGKPAGNLLFELELKVSPLERGDGFLKPRAVPKHDDEVSS